MIFVDDVSAYSGFDTFVCVIRNACKNLYLSSKLSLETPPNLEFNYGKVGGLNQMFTLRNQNVFVCCTVFAAQRTQKVFVHLLGKKLVDCQLVLFV